MWAIRKQAPASNKAAIAAAILAVAVTVLYAYLIDRQPGDDGLRPWLIGASLLVAACILLASTLVAKVAGRLLLVSLAACTLLIWSVLGAFSIGVPSCRPPYLRWSRPVVRHRFCRPPTLG